ncbi:MAG: site-specific DNA-methyltransferase, partial [Sphingomonadales bacterium]
VVLDPFFGTGTTGAVAKRLGREWIGCEREPAYREVATKRIEKELPLDESALATMASARTQPKVAFGAVVEAGLLPPGTQVFDKKKRWTATVRADGSLLCDKVSGSIHGLGKELQGAPSCNGWAFWHYVDGDAVKPIDAVRQTYLLSVED